MDRHRDCHTEWSKSNTNIIWYRLYVESKKKKWYKRTYLQSHRYRKQIYGQEGRRDKLGYWDWHTHTTKEIINKDLQDSTGNATQYSVMSYIWEKNLKNTDICITDSLWYTQETNATL